MKKIPPQRRSSKAWIDTHDDEAILIDVNPLDMSTDIPEPDPELPENIRWHWDIAKLGSPSPEILQFLFNVTKEYMIQIEFDDPERNAYPGQVRKYVSKVEKAVSTLEALLDPNTSDKRQAAIIRHMTSKGEAAFAMHDLAEAVEAFRRTAIELSDKVDETKQGPAGTKVSNERKVLFAAKLIEVFGEHNLPTEIRSQDLLTQVLGVCLEAAGEPHQNPEMLLASAARVQKPD